MMENNRNFPAGPTAYSRSHKKSRSSSKGWGIARIVLLNLMCIAGIVYAAVPFSTPEKPDLAVWQPQGVFWDEGLPETVSETASAATTAAPAQTAVSSEEKAAAASAGAVKGKVLTQYISPYQAGLSYGGVYVKNSTELAIDLKKELAAKLGFTISSGSAPQVLIMHTHTTESFLSSDTGYYTASDSPRSTANKKNMVSVGNIVADCLNKAGIVTLHDTTQHDYPEYTGSYSRAAKTINSYLKKYPSVKIVLDLHRDAITKGDTDKVKLVTTVNGKKAAQVMLVMGSQSGGVTNFPDWKQNFRLAIKLQQTIEKKYPTLARPVMLMPKNYNESLCPGSLLIEFGTDANTFDEVYASAGMVGDSLVSLLQTLK